MTRLPRPRRRPDRERQWWEPYIIGAGIGTAFTVLIERSWGLLSAWLARVVGWVWGLLP